VADEYSGIQVSTDNLSVGYHSTDFDDHGANKAVFIGLLAQDHQPNPHCNAFNQVTSLLSKSLLSLLLLLAAKSRLE